MNVQQDMEDDLKELIALVRRDERFSAVFAHGALHLDWRSSLCHRRRTRRIEELSRKYGLL